jgi:ABC-2 type transport system permease protein
MNRMFAIVEREMRKFFRSPALMMVSMTLPLVQLLILGHAFGGKIRNARMGVVDYDHGAQSLKIHEAFDAIAANIRTFTTVPYTNEVQARSTPPSSFQSNTPAASSQATPPPLASSSITPTRS